MYGSPGYFSLHPLHSRPGCFSLHPLHSRPKCLCQQSALFSQQDFSHRRSFPNRCNAYHGFCGGSAGSGFEAMAGCPHCAGSEDGSVRIWDAPTRQTVRTLSNPAKGPISSLLVLDRPPFMAAGQGASKGLAAAPGAPARASGGPKRPQPLGSLAKFQDGMGWQGAPVVLDGRLRHR